MHYSHLLTAFAKTPWAVLEEKLIAMRMFLIRKARGEEIPAEEVLAAMAESRQASPRSSGRVAVLPIVGTIVHRGSDMEAACGLPSCQYLGKQFDAMMADPGIKTIVLDIESPGGSVYGVQELGDKIAAAEGKKVVACVNALAASGAYWIAAQADEIWMTPTGHVGSVGVFIAHEDISKALEAEGVNVTMVSAGKYKTEGAIGPLTEEARAYLQSEVDRYYEMFVEALASGRQTTAHKVKKNFGEGRVVGAQQAKEAGMIDKIGTMQDLLKSLGVSFPGSSAQAAGTPFKRLKAALDLAEVS